MLAARIDNSRLDPSGTKGLEFRQELERKLDDWQAPPPEKEVKPMNIVVDMPKKRRGGKRYRKMKEKYAMTELEKQQNRVVFGVAEEEVLVFDETEGLGMINQNTGLGKIRAAAADTRTKGKYYSQLLYDDIQTYCAVKPKSTAAMKSKSLSSSTTSGLATSLAFTPVQGLELVDPEAQKKRLQEINSRWFSNH